jgi:hypothetical protein
MFGKDRTRAIALRELEPIVVELDRRAETDGLPHHDEQAARPTLAQLLAGLAAPEFPECLGVFRCVSQPTFEPALAAGPRLSSAGDLAELFTADDMWRVE